MTYTKIPKMQKLNQTHTEYLDKSHQEASNENSEIIQ